MWCWWTPAGHGLVKPESGIEHCLYNDKDYVQLSKMELQADILMASKGGVHQCFCFGPNMAKLWEM
jgi:hypothetical protein